MNVTNRDQLSVFMAIGITMAWIGIELFVMNMHELWLDEAHHWLLVKNSQSFGDLLENMRYEGHPPGWDFLLFAVSRVSSSFVAMQVLHLCFAGGTVFVLLRHAPFPLWVKLVLPFTYFFGFEYAVISRNYAPAVFFILLACTQLRDIPKNYLRIACFLGLATLFHAYAGIVALLMMGWCFLEVRKTKAATKTALLPLAVFAICCGVAVYFVIPPPDHFLFSIYPDGGISINRLGTIASLPFVSLLHFPTFAEGNWWNANIFIPGNKILAGILVLIFWFIVPFLFRKNKPVLLFYITGTVFLSLAMLFTPMPISVRHAGFVAVLFLVSLWLWRVRTDVEFTPALKGFIAVIMTVQSGAFLLTAASEMEEPFSEAKETAEWIKQNRPNTPVVVYPEYNGPAVSCYLGKDVYYTEQEKMGNFASWKADRFLISSDEMLEGCRRYMKKKSLDSIVVVTGYNGFFLPDTIPGLKRVALFDQGTVQSENYVIYIMK